MVERRFQRRVSRKRRFLGFSFLSLLFFHQKGRGLQNTSDDYLFLGLKVKSKYTPFSDSEPRLCSRIDLIEPMDVSTLFVVSVKPRIIIHLCTSLFSSECLYHFKTLFLSIFSYIVFFVFFKEEKVLDKENG